MDEHMNFNLDQEFKRYLKIVKPYISQLADQKIAAICWAWIQRLTDSTDEDKTNRNKCIFKLCYQLAKGVIVEPFITPPSVQLPYVPDCSDSDSSTDAEYVVIDTVDSDNILFNKVSLGIYESEDSDETKTDLAEEKDACHPDPVIFTPIKKGEQAVVEVLDFEPRKTNIIVKLREIKKHNELLQHELESLKVISICKKKGNGYNSLNTDSNKYHSITSLKIDQAVSTHFDLYENTELVQKLKEFDSERNELKTLLKNLEDENKELLVKLKSSKDEMTKRDIQNKDEIKQLASKSQTQIAKIKASMHEDFKNLYEETIEETKYQYEIKIKKLQRNHESELDTVKYDYEQCLKEKDKVIAKKSAEIEALQSELKDLFKNIHVILNKFVEKPNDDYSLGSMKLKAIDLEKHLNKIEKSKSKNTKMFESRISQLQHEKRSLECSLQLQLALQKAQAVNEVSEENQSTLGSALDKLEQKYKDIVATMQGTAIQRRMQDQMALETILQAACGQQNGMYCNPSLPENIPEKAVQNDANINYENKLAEASNKKSGAAALPNTPYENDDYYLHNNKFKEVIGKKNVPNRDVECVRRSNSSP